MASLVAQLVKNLPERWEILDLIPGLGRSPGEGKGYPLHYSGLENSMDCSPWDRKDLDMTQQLSLSLWGFPDSSVGKEAACNAGDPSLMAGLGRSTGEGKGYPLQYSGLENSMDYIVHGVAKSQTWLSNFHFQKWVGRLLRSFFLLFISYWVKFTKHKINH